MDMNNLKEAIPAKNFSRLSQNSQGLHMNIDNNMFSSFSIHSKKNKSFSAPSFSETYENKEEEDYDDEKEEEWEREEFRQLSPNQVDNVRFCSAETSLLVPEEMDQISLFSDNHKICKRPRVHELESITTILNTNNENMFPVLSNSIRYNLCQNSAIADGEEDPLLSPKHVQPIRDTFSTSNSDVYNEFKLPGSPSCSAIGKSSEITSRWTENPLTSSSNSHITRMSKNIPKRKSSVVEYAIEKYKMKPPVLMGQFKRDLLQPEQSLSYNAGSSETTSDETHNPLSQIRNRPIDTESGPKIYSQTKNDMCKKINNAVLNFRMERHEPKIPLAFHSNTGQNLNQQLRCNTAALTMSTSSSSYQRNNIYSSSEENEDPITFIRNLCASNSDNVDEPEDSDIIGRMYRPNANCRTITNEKMSQIPSTSNQQMQEFICPSTTSNSNTDMIVLSVFWRKGILGAAYYSADTSEIHVAADIVDIRPDFNILHSLYGLVQPSKVVVPAHMPDSFISVLKSLTGYASPANQQPAPADKKLHILPRKEYNLEACRRRVLLLRLPDEPKECNEDEHLVYLNSLMDMSNESMIQALGAVLKWLDVSWGFLHLEQDKQPSIMTINTLSLEDLVMIDRDSYEALQIFSTRPHPSGFKRGMPGSHREGLSIFGIFNRCKSPVGSNLMRVMLRHPTRKIDELNARLDVVQFCTHPNNEDTVGNMLFCLKHIKSITKIISRLTRLSVSIREWKSLHKTLYYSILLGTICEPLTSKAKLFSEIAGSMTEEMQQMEYSITRIIDFKESEKQNTFVVNIGVDEELDRKKLEYGGIPKLMTSVAHQELNNLPSFINECSLVYIPEIGYLLAIFAWKENMSVEEWEIPGIEFMFKLGSIGHYKSARCRELDEMMGDTLVDIMKLESQILLRLVQFIQERITPLHKLVNKAAELDCLIAFALVAKENNYRRPELTLSRVLEIRGGLHPLQSLCVDSFVPNDTFSGDNHTLMKIITGPNSSGKSVYMKQVALIAFLAHIGSFVPAESAKIGILDHIHTRIQTVESILVNISAFVIDLRQMLMSLYNSTSSSLIIVDEFGKGTTEIDGLALLASCLDHFLSREDKCPHIFAATHFHNVVDLIRKSKYLKLQTMDCLFENDGQVVNLFKLKDGSVNSSCALAIAETIRRNETSIRAQKILDAMKSGEQIHALQKCKMDIKISKYKVLAQKILSTDPLDINQVEELNKPCSDI